ncbi:MAG: hypothetical protein N3E46_14855 [Gemmataceae bacterium]|nr:hypothetical protein [Gemmataceae bacterium]
MKERRAGCAHRPAFREAHPERTSPVVVLPGLGASVIRTVGSAEITTAFQAVNPDVKLAQLAAQEECPTAAAWLTAVAAVWVLPLPMPLDPQALDSFRPSSDLLGQLQGKSSAAGEGG